MGIFSGLVVGTIISIAGGFWFARREIARHHNVIAEAQEQEAIERKTVPLEKRLRDAIYDCERNLKSCKNQINEICKNQLDLLKDVGKKSHIEVANKPLFFEYFNPISKQRHFYYQKDLAKNIAPEILENTKKIAKKYSDHIQLVITQQKLFEKLILSHKENLDRIYGVKNQNNQAKKVSLHNDKLTTLERNNAVEERAIYNELLIEDITEELDHQEECFRQYIALNQKYGSQPEKHIKEQFNTELKIIIQQLETKDPSSPQ